MNQNQTAIVSGRAHRELSEKIAQHLNMDLLKTEIAQFKDGEIRAYLGYHHMLRQKKRS